jgi:2-dehydropantoate 2-reductase
MHFAVLGAGALGTLFGARAWLAGGTRVSLIARAEQVKAVMRDGVRLRGPAGDELVVGGPGLVAVEHSALVEGDIDCLLIAVKQYDMAAALADGREVRGRVRCVFSLQNGVGQDSLIADTFGPEAVIGGMTMEGAASEGPGVIRHLLASTTYIGELNGAATPRVRGIADAFRRGGLATEVVADIEAARWTKFVQSCAASGVCGVTRLGYAPATATEAGARLYVRLVREGAAVMRARGMEPGAWFLDTARVREVADLPEEAAVTLVRRLARDLIAGGYVGSTSLARDLQEGRRSEADALMGSMQRMAEELGLPTPTMRAVYWAVTAVDTARPPDPAGPGG